VISSPKPRLRVAQDWVQAHILAPLPVHGAAAAFRPGLSVADNAKRHTDSAVVVRLDFRDFFPSLTLPRIRRLFQSFGYNPGVASLLPLLCTEAPRVAVTLDGERHFVVLGERVLPQGASPSPALTNLLCRRLDARLTSAAQSLGSRYSRYADDLVFSRADSTAPVGMLLALAQQIVADSQLVINEDKTVVLRPQHRHGDGRGGQRNPARFPRRPAPLPGYPAPLPDAGRHRGGVAGDGLRCPRLCLGIPRVPAHGLAGAGRTGAYHAPMAVAVAKLGR